MSLLLNTLNYYFLFSTFMEKAENTLTVVKFVLLGWASYQNVDISYSYSLKGGGKGGVGLGG